MREAPSLQIIEALLGAGAMVRAYDPVAIEEAKRVLGPREGLSYADAPLKACEAADALIIVTEWSEFRSPDFYALKAALRTPLLFDGRNLFAPDLMRGLGFEYHSIGRGVVSNVSA
jgi:UDPglucose 6-dehydrogenase